ncbi:proline-rich protein PRCC isoform X2 [Anguilla rostrata]
MGLNLPPPKRDTSQRSGSPQIPASFMSDMDPGQNLDPKGAHPPISSGLHLNLPKPKKRTEPVKITIPELQRGDSDSEEEEPVSKKALSQSSGGLSSLLPQPRNLVVKETQRLLVPHTLTKRPQEPRAPARPASGAAQPLGASASPSAIKAAAKSAALQLARQIAQEDEGSDEELAPENYFSLSESSQAPPVLPAPDPDPPAAATLPLPPGTEPPFQSDAPLEFSSAPQNFPGSSGAWEEHQQEAFYPRYPESSSQGTEQQPLSQDYYSGGYYQDPEPAATEVEGPGSSSLFDDEAFRRLQGKRNRGKEEVKFLEIKGDDQLSGSQQWMTKSMTEEKEQRKSFSKKKGEQPTGQQRRKHQITYLIHQAKERELELKNNWAENKLTRRQTQAKYGF